MEALFESDGWGGPDEEPRVSEVWEAIEAIVSRAEIKGDAEYGPLATFALGKIDLAKIRRNWEDILRVVASRARATALSSSGRVTARVEIFSAKTRVTPEARSESAWVSRHIRTASGG